MKLSPKLLQIISLTLICISLAGNINAIATKASPAFFIILVPVGVLFLTMANRSHPPVA